MRHAAGGDEGLRCVIVLWQAEGEFCEGENIMARQHHSLEEIKKTSGA